MRPIIFLALVLALFLPVLPASAASGGPLAQGIADYDDESYEEAIVILTEALRLDPSSAEAAFYLGLSYLKVQDYGAAAARLREAASLKPDHAGAHLNLAQALYHVDEHAEALSALDAALRSGANPADAHFLRGLVLARQDKGQEAIEAFGRAKAADPSFAQAADYQTALVYVKEDRLEEAKEVFNEVVVRDPSTDLAAYADEYSRAIARKQDRDRPFKLTVGLRYEYDDNVLLKPADSSAANGITGEIDRREVLNLRAEYSRKAGGPWSLKGLYTLYLSNQHHLETHDIQSHTVTLTPGYDLENGSVSVGLSYNHTLVEDAGYLHSTTVAPAYNVRLGARTLASLSARLQKREFLLAPFTEDEDRDSLDAAVAASLFSFFSGDSGFMNLRYEANREDADGSNWKYSGHRVALSLLYPVTERLRVQAYADAYYQDYSRSNTFFGKKRKDRTYAQSALLAWEFYDRTEFVAQFTHVRGDSNIALYDYDRNIVSTGIEYKY